MASRTKKRRGAGVSPQGSLEEVPAIRSGMQRSGPGSKAGLRAMTSSVSPLPSIGRRGGFDANEMSTQQVGVGASLRGMGTGGWDWNSMTDEERRHLSRMQTKEHNKLLSHSQREVHTQREQIEGLRIDNARLRAQIAERVQEQNEQLNEKKNAAVNLLMGKKFEVEEAIEKELENLEALKKQVKRQGAVSKARLEDKKEGLKKPSEKEHEKTQRLQEERVHHYAQVHSEVIAAGRILRTEIDEIRRDKLRIKKVIVERAEVLEAKSVEIIQLINIANAFYADRTKCHLMRSELISQAGSDAEEHRDKIQELNNRLEYCDLMMQEREEDYQKALLEAKRQASNLSDPLEDLREAERKRQQELVEAVDRLMHSLGVWDVNELVSRFLAKEERFNVQHRYLDALRLDAQTMEVGISDLQGEAARLMVSEPAEHDATAKLQDQIEAATRRAQDWEESSGQSMDTLNRVSAIVARLRARSSKSRLLDVMRPARRRWALIRANIRRIALMQSSAVSNASQMQALKQRAQQAERVDPRRKNLKEQLGDLECAQQGMDVLVDLSFLEEQTLHLIRYVRNSPPSVNGTALLKTGSASQGGLPAGVAVVLPVAPPRKHGKEGTRAAIAGTASANIASVVPPLEEEVKGMSSTKYPQGPKFPLQGLHGRVTALVIPSLRDIDSPRDSDPVTSAGLHALIRDHGFSERVVEKMRRRDGGIARLQSGAALLKSPIGMAPPVVAPRKDGATKSAKPKGRKTAGGAGESSGEEEEEEEATVLEGASQEAELSAVTTDP